MGKRYYCDYCNKSFPYSIEARKKHLNGYQHQTIYNKYYDQFKSATQKYNEEIGKKKCIKFHSGQKCFYQNSCIYSHLNQSELENLKVQSEYEVKQKFFNLKPSFQEITKLIDCIETRENSGVSSSVQKLFNEFSIPHNIPNSDFLPVSLKPFTINDIQDCEFSEWG